MEWREANDRHSQLHERHDTGSLRKARLGSLLLPAETREPRQGLCNQVVWELARRESLWIYFPVPE